MNPKAGDRVEITTKDETFEGILMPRPELLKGDITVIKLDSGYNIGIENEKITKVKVLEQYKESKAKVEKIKHNPALPTVSVLSCGGTISSRVDYRTGGVHADYTAEDFVAMCPELVSIANIKTRQVMSVMSEDMAYEEWATLAKAVVEELKTSDGIVVTMGTDTLHFATAALSFFIAHLNKPVIFTAAQRSIDRGSSDAFMNLICAVIAAAKFNGAEVLTCLHATTNDDYCILNRGTKVRKMHTSRRDAFRPINELPIAEVWQDGRIEIINRNYKKKTNLEPVLDVAFEQKTALITIYPGMDPEIIDFYTNRGYKGIVLAATALGHVPTAKENYSLLPNIERAIKKGVAVVIASQTIYGRTHPYVYTNLRKLSVQLGCIFVEDMLPETAYVKLGWVLGHTSNMEDIKKAMLTNIAGEITERTDTAAFLA